MDHIDAQQHLGDPAEFGVPKGGLKKALAGLSAPIELVYSESLKLEYPAERAAIINEFRDQWERVIAALPPRSSVNAIALGITNSAICRAILDDAITPNHLTNDQVHEYIRRARDKADGLRAGKVNDDFRRRHRAEPVTVINPVEDVTPEVAADILANHVWVELAPDLKKREVFGVELPEAMQRRLNLLHALADVYPMAGAE
jgi:hypothetical protein